MAFTIEQLSQMALMGSIGGAANSVIGSYFDSATQKINLQTRANIAGINARIAELGAQSALFQGQQQVGSLTLRAGQLKSSQRASMAANGVDLGTGSAAEVQASTDILKETDALTIDANAVRSAWGYRTESVNQQNQALMSRANAKGISPGSSAASSLLGSAGSVAHSWYLMRKNRLVGTPLATGE